MKLTKQQKRDISNIKKRGKRLLSRLEFGTFKNAPNHFSIPQPLLTQNWQQLTESDWKSIGKPCDPSNAK